MTKLLWLAVLVTIACRMLTGQWPWTLLGIAGSSREKASAARRLLGVAANASRKDILDAHRRLIAEVHPDRGGSSARVHEANEARDILINTLPPESRDETS